MRDIDLRDFGPVKREETPSSAYDRLIDALEKLQGKLESADNTRIGDLSRLLDEMTGLCDRAHGAARLLESKCKAEGR